MIQSGHQEKKMRGTLISVTTSTTYSVVAGTSMVTRIFNFPAARVAREFAEKLARNGIQATILVEATA
jgi:hypothetical protein